MTESRRPQKKGRERRQRIDGPAAKTEMIREEAKGIHQPPPYLKLTKGQEQFWRDIMLTRAREMWTESDLILAHQLAIIHHDIDKLNKRINRRDEQRVVDGKINPWHKALKELHDLAVKYTQLLQLHPRATMGEARDQGMRNQAAREARQQMEEAKEAEGAIASMDDDDDLIPRPNNTIQ